MSTNADLVTTLKTLFKKWEKDRQPLEEKWTRNEHAFDGVSDGFWKKEETADWRSDTFVPHTKIKVLSAYAIVIDMIIQNGTMPFSLELSPWDNIIMEDLPEEERVKIQDDIDDMTGLIKQQIIDCNGEKEMIKCVMSGAKLGEYFWESHIHEVKRRGFKKVSFAPQGFIDNTGKYSRLEFYETTINAPAFEYVSCWDMFRDLETNDMQKSQGYVHRKYVSAYDLRKLKGKPYYDDKAIDRAIVNNANVKTIKKNNGLKPALRKLNEFYNNMEMFVFWCRVPRATVEAYKAAQGNESVSTEPLNDSQEGDEVEIHAVLVGDEIIRFVEGIPEGTRPHGRVEWEIRLDDNHGCGVADNAEPIQKSLNGMTRAFEDNKKLTANVMLAIKKSLLGDWDGEIKPGCTPEINEECDDVRQAMQQITLNDVGETLLSGIGMFERYMDESTMLPKILQGAQYEKQKADTLGEINILQANAGKYIGSVIKNIDEGHIEPVVQRFYEYNMLDPDLDKGKGNYIAKACGFSGYNEKISRITKLLQVLNLVLTSPVIQQETRVKSILEPLFRALELDPQIIFKTQEEKAADSQAQMQARQQLQDEQGIIMLAEKKAELEVAAGKIKAQLEADLIKMKEEFSMGLVKDKIGQGKKEKPVNKKAVNE